MIVNHPARAASALGDLSAERSHLLIGSRDILSRPEWRELLAEDQRSATIRAINSNQLQHWIQGTFSASTAAPWLEALQALTGHQATSVSPGIATTPNAGAMPLARNLGIAAGCALLTALAITLFNQPWNRSATAQAPSAPSPSGSPAGSGSDSPAAESGAAEPAPDGSNSKGAGEADAAAPHTGQEPGGHSFANSNRNAPTPGGSAENAQAQRPGGPTSPQHRHPAAAPASGNRTGGRREVLFPESGDAAATASPVRRQNWPQLQASLENGESRPNDWIIADAQGRLSHWIQSLDWRGGVLSIRLRTHEAIQPATCKAVSQLYQRQFSASGKPSATVLIESSRHAGKNSVSGFLPICRLTASGSFSVLT